MNGTGEAIRIARLALGMTQTDLSQAAGMTQATLSRYENGTRDPDDAALVSLANVLLVTPEALRHGERMLAPLAVEAHMRRRGSAKVSDWTRAEAQLNLLRLQVDRVFGKIGMSPQLALPAVDPIETEPEEAAMLVRHQWHMPIGPVDSVIRWMEAAGIIIIRIALGTRRIDGLSQGLGRFPVVIINDEMPPDRQRLTLAHELGHLVMHNEYADVDMEAQANKFAAEFLMPEMAIKSSLTSLTIPRLEALKLQWGVSMQALVERSYALRQLSQEKRTGFYKEFSRRGWRTHEPYSDAVNREIPTLADRLWRDLALQGLPSDTVVALAGVDADHPTRLFQDQAGPEGGRRRLRVV